ncbi:MAG: hypothetical protein JWL71_2854 [Acidobacteria bacterium]|nr:hypothetical protein [Acidobacteriota bacterium]
MSAMRRRWWTAVPIGAAVLGIAIGGGAATPPLDRVAALSAAIAQQQRTLTRDRQTGYLSSVLDALGVPPESQLLVFSKTGVQRAFTSPRTPRAVYFDQSVAVGYAPGAPFLEVAVHDPHQGVLFYTVDQRAASPVFTRQTSCLSCHVSPATLGVPGLIARSNTVGDDGQVIAGDGTHDVTHETPHPDRWGGWFVTSEGAAPPYSQLAHRGNVTFSGKGNTSNQVFVDWLSSAPETRGYLSSSSDIVGLLLFDHQVHAINLLTRLQLDSRSGSAGAGRLATELADYLLFAGEAPPLSPLTPRPGFAERLEASVPKDRRGRSLGQLDMVDRLLRYPCSYMIYSDAFDALPAAIKQTVYRRMIDVLSSMAAPRPRVAMTSADRAAILDILRDTKPDFPAR